MMLKNTYLHVIRMKVLRISLVTDGHFQTTILTVVIGYYYGMADFIAHVILSFLLMVDYTKQATASL